jgi:hypothetical protein
MNAPAFLQPDNFIMAMPVIFVKLGLATSLIAESGNFDIPDRYIQTMLPDFENRRLGSFCHNE